MHMRIAFVAALTSLMGMPVLASDVEHRMSVGGRIAIDTEGRVTEQTLDSDLAPGFEAALRNHIAAWRFEPVLIDDRAVVATTRMNLSLRLVEVDDTFKVSVDGVSFGSPLPRANQQRGAGALRYPADARERGVGGRVLLAVRLDADGSVVELHPYQTSLNVRIRSEREAERMRTALERASLRAVARWRFDLSEFVDGEASATSVMVPIEFRITNNPSRVGPGTWHSLVPGPIRPAPWQEQDEQLAIDASDLGHGEALALNSRFRLMDDEHEDQL